MHWRRFVVALTLGALSGAAEVPTIKQSIEFRRPSGPRISPDGRYVAYSVQETNWKDNAFVRQIWIHDTETERNYQLTAGSKSAASPEWSPDGSRILFSSSRDGDSKLYVISPFGGEALALTDGEMAPGSYEWSPDGKKVAFTSAGKKKPEKQEKREKKYGEFEQVDRDYRMSHLWVVDAPEAIPPDPEQLPEPERITEGGEYTVGGFAWSPDGAYIAFSATVDPDRNNYHTADLYTVRLSDKGVKKIVGAGGPDSNPVWSPDGNRIAYQTAAGKERYYYLNGEIAVVPAEGGEPAVLTAGFDEDPYLIDWGDAGLYFQAQRKTTGQVYRLDPDSKRVEPITETGGWSVHSMSFSRDFRMAAFSAAKTNGFYELRTSALAPFEPKPFTRSAEQFEDFELATKEVISWTSQDGAVIEGILIKPADYDPSKRYPLLVVIHGGPTGVDTPHRSADRYYPVERFAAKGALVLRPNYRGSAGYGEKFRSLNVRNLGVGDAWDVVSGVDHLIGQGLVDGDRAGAMGWSQGGYISAFLTCASDRFKAISVGAGISDWMTYYVNTDIHPFTRQYLHATPWDDPAIYRKTSPISYVENAQTPTLIQHGENDRRVPLPNSYELYQALRDRNVPVEFVVYKGFGHGITKPKELLHVMQQNYDWFSKHIWGEEPAPEEDESDDIE